MHRKHVLCDVPLALSQADAERITTAADEANVRFLVCQTQRFLAPLQRLREETASRGIRHVIVRLLLNRTTNVGITGRRRSWTDDIVWHHGSHALDTTLLAARRERRGGDPLSAGESEAGRRSTPASSFGPAPGASRTIALSYTAEAPSTDFLVHLRRPQLSAATAASCGTTSRRGPAPGRGASWTPSRAAVPRAARSSPSCTAPCSA